jgi:hypothetical protein
MMTSTTLDLPIICLICMEKVMPSGMPSTSLKIRFCEKLAISRS